MSTFELTFSRVIVTTLTPNTDSSFTVPSGYVWKIESAGIAGTNGVVYLKSNSNEKIAILFSSINRNDYSSPLPYWLNDAFSSGKFLNESNFPGSVSITEYFINTIA
jgi:hypothetical protein